MFCNVAVDAVYQSVDVDTIYRLPLAPPSRARQKLAAAQHLVARVAAVGVGRGRPRITSRRKVTVGFIGKYVSLVEAYKSLNEALLHGGVANDCRVEIKHIDSEELERAGVAGLAGYDGILVAPGFGARGTEGKIAAVRHARENKVPYFGICFGMQMACSEYARHVCRARPGQLTGVIDGDAARWSTSCRTSAA